ncbi:MAG: ice-binding family protein [bacterium]|nr:ice-binding family protein [bacterium]
MKGILFALLLVLGLAGTTPAFAATSPSLGAADSYSVLSGAAATNGGAGTTTISGNLGVSPAAAYSDVAASPTVFLTAGNPHLADVSAANAQSAQLAVFNGPGGIEAGTQPCTTTYGATQDLSGLVLDPGVYCTPVDFLLSGTLTLNGTGSPATDVWIFRSERDFIGTGTANVVFSGTGGVACNVWWRLVRDATFTAGNDIVGNILAANDITFGQDATLDGRAFAYTGSVTMLGNIISGPTCAVTPPSSSGRRPLQASINVVKTVINDNGGSKTVADFPLFVNEMEVSSGQTTILASGSYSVTESSDINYTQTFSGDCDINGQLFVNEDEDKFCIITNNDIGSPVAVLPVPPLIAVVKVPSPLSLPNGPGNVLYTYTLKNIGTVPVTDITMVGDTCAPLDLISGDLNNNNQLEVSETWIYHCSTRLSETHTNTVVATGWANGLSVVDIASATVIVGEPIVPPLIHVTKVPRPLTLPAGGGMVTYVERITNPGTVPLSNVRLTDDKCGPLRYRAGDRNRNSMLDPNERWTYTCRTRLSETTTNTAIASGEANGITVRDFAIVTVVVAAPVPPQFFAPVPPVPTLPKTGFPPSELNSGWEQYLRLFVPLLNP